MGFSGYYNSIFQGSIEFTKTREKFYLRKKTALSFQIWGFVNVAVLQNEGTDELQYNDNNINHLERQQGLF